MRKGGGRIEIQIEDILYILKILEFRCSLLKSEETKFEYKVVLVEKQSLQIISEVDRLWRKSLDRIIS